MINWLHTNLPQPILADFGFIQIHYYGLLFVLGMILALLSAIYLAKKQKISAETIIDLVFWLIIFGLIGARLYDVGLEYKYYFFNHLIDIVKVWQGGLAIHGGIIAGLVVIYYFSKKRKINFWTLSALLVPGLALAQAIGRWGNYFNQEIYGQPTTLPWGIPITGNAGYYHPVFLYESLGNFIIFLILILGHYFLFKKKIKAKTIVFTYLILYSILRFSLEFIRLDFAPVIDGWRWPQIISIVIIVASLIILSYDFLNKKNKNIK